MAEIPELNDRELSEVGVLEEGQELAIEICKAQRFGWHAANFLNGTTPMERFAGELGDLLGCLDFFIDEHPEISLYAGLVQSRMRNKRAKLKHFNDLATRDTPFNPI